MNSLLLAAAITFLAPQSGGQAVGPQAIEIATTIANVDRVEFYVDGALAGVARKPPYRIAHDFGTSLAAREIEAKVYSDGYRTTTSAKVLTAAMTAGETMNVDLVEVPMRVRAPGMLSAADLRVTENGVEQAIRDIHPERGAARFVFVIDRSLSMGGGKLQAALRAVEAESNMLRPGDTKEIDHGEPAGRFVKLLAGDRPASADRYWSGRRYRSGRRHQFGRSDHCVGSDNGGRSYYGGRSQYCGSGQRCRSRQRHCRGEYCERRCCRSRHFCGSRHDCVRSHYAGRWHNVGGGHDVGSGYCIGSGHHAGRRQHDSWR